MVMFAEVRKDGQWHKVGKWFVSTYKEMEGQLTDRVFDGRDNNLKFILQDAGWPGMPNDASEEIHNHAAFKSNLSIYSLELSEILNIDWDMETCKTGYISEWQYERLRWDDIKPVNILTKPRVDSIAVAPFMMDLIIDNPSLRKKDTKYFVKYQYDKYTMKELCNFFFYMSIQGLVRLIPEGGTIHDVRIIFSI